MEIFNVSDHGDMLERQATDFIRENIPYYEKVWQTYIGNIGNATIAPLPNYDRQENRIAFSEHSYSLLEACFINKSILNSNIFKTPIDSFANHLEFNKAFICFFAYLGRIHDTIIKAATNLGLTTDRINAELKEYYQARNIILHGKKIPFILDELGLAIMPILKTERVDGVAWHDKTPGNKWPDVAQMQTIYTDDNCEYYFKGLLRLVNDIYAQFLEAIKSELKSRSTALSFYRISDYDPATSGQSGYSGYSGTSKSTPDTKRVLDFYKIKDKY